MSEKKVLKDTPLSEVTLRRYERPDKLEGRELIKKLCLSLGLLQPGDSRDVIVDIFSVILREKRAQSVAEIEEKVIELRTRNKLPVLGVATSNIRRQLKRLKDLFLVESIQNKYRMTENLTLLEIFEEKIEQFYLKSITDRVKDYCRAVK